MSLFTSHAGRHLRRVQKSPQNCYAWHITSINRPEMVQHAILTPSLKKWCRSSCRSYSRNSVMQNKFYRPFLYMHHAVRVMLIVPDPMQASCSTFPRINSTTYSSSSCSQCRPRRSEFLADLADVRQSCINSLLFADVAYQADIARVTQHHLPEYSDKYGSGSQSPHCKRSSGHHTTERSWVRELRQWDMDSAGT